MTKAGTNREKLVSVTQADKFRDLARELECDDDEATFAERLAKVLKAPKPPTTSPTDKRQ